MYDALSQLLQYMGNDPRVFVLYFTYKCFYAYFLRRRNYEYGGLDKFCTYGIDWIIPLEDFKTKKRIQPFFAKNFQGYVVCDFEPLFTFFFFWKILGIFKFQ